MSLAGWLYDGSGEHLTTPTGAWLGTADNFYPGGEAPMTSTYQLDVCTNFARIGVADTFTFAAAESRNAVGEWEANIPSGGVEFQTGSTIGDVDSIIVWDTTNTEAVPVAAGIIAPTGMISTGIETSIGPGGKRWRLTGVDLFGMLGTRLAYPDPTADPPWADAYDERTGVASTVIAGYINANIGTTALPARQIEGVTVTDSVVGDEVTWTARLQPLSTLVSQLCNAAGIVCRPQMPAPGDIRFVLTTGSDLTNSTVIADKDISGAITVTEASARATFVVAGGSGQADARLFSTATTGQTGIDRLESFYDVSNLSGSAVSLAALGSLTEQSAETAVVLDTLLPRIWRYRQHFNIGDTISVEADGVRYSCLVDGVAFTITPTQSNVRPLLGRTTNNEATQIMRELWGTTARFNTNIV